MELERSLDNGLAELEKWDRSRMLSILGAVDHQFEAALEAAQTVRLERAPGIRNIVVLGLGGSAIGGDLVKAYLGADLKVPCEVVRAYAAPGYADRDTLALVSSYSGDTEETLAALQAVRDAGATIACLTSGGELERIARRNGYPVLTLPRGLPPRAALPSSFVALLSVLSGMGLISDRTGDLRSLVPWVRGRLRAYGPGNPARDNQARSLALELFGRVPVVYGSAGRLFPIARRWAGQFSENAKTLAYCNELPEMNHNEIVGWMHPDEALKRFVPVFLRDDREDHERVRVRLEITRELLEGRVEPVLEFWTAGESWLERMWTLVLLGDFASLYLALLNREDPTPVEAIDLLKSRLGGLDGRASECISKVFGE